MNMAWNKEVLAKLNEVATVQNHPNDDQGKSFQDNPIWVVTNDDKVYLRAGKGKESKWYQSGIKNGGSIELDGQNFDVDYVSVDDPAEISAVTEAYLKKYHGQYPIDMMISDKCANNDINKQNKAKNTFLKKYGVDNPLKSKIIKQKMINTRLNTPNFWENIVIKRQQTCLKKYGVISYTQTNEFIIKFKETCLKKYGFDNPTKTESVKQKIKNTCLEKYNCINGGMSSKAIKTFKQHKSFNSSKAEKQLYDMIKNIYENTKYQYTSESYPYMCDYFIPELNLYIEYQGSMFHNMHLYKNNDEDNIQLNKFKIKAQTHLRYKSLIEQWTIRDVKKYNIACNNKLNYLLIYPKWHKNWYSYLYNKNKEKYIESLNNSLCTILNKFKNKSNTQIIIGES